MLICIPTSVLGKEAPWNLQEEGRRGGWTLTCTRSWKPRGKAARGGTSPARQQSTTAWKGPSAGKTFGKSRPRASPWGLLGSGPEEQNVPFTKGCAGGSGAGISSAGSGEPWVILLTQHPDAQSGLRQAPPAHSSLSFPPCNWEPSCLLGPYGADILWWATRFLGF